MTQQNINFGLSDVRNDGETLFSAFTKIQANFDELYASVASDTAALAAHIADSSDAHNSSAIGFTQAGTGAVSRTALAKLRDRVSVFDFGATGDGVTDDTTALQNAITYCGTSGKVLDWGPGDFRISSALNMTAHVVIQGAGWDNTLVRLTSGTQDGIVINSENGGSISGIQIMGTSSSSQTAGALVRITGPAGGNQNQIYFLRDLRLLWGFISVDFDAAQVWTIDNCYMLGNPLTGIGVVIDNTEFPGNGELNISNTLIQGGDATTTWGGSGVLHRSGVNLKIVNSEIFGWINGYNLTLGDATAMAGTYICNSVFSQVENAIVFAKGTGTQYNIITIAGNQIVARNPIQSDSNTGWLFDITVVGNFLGVGQGDPVSSSTGTGISFPAVDTFTIIGNVIQGASSNNSIVIGSNSSNGYISGNALRGSLNGISNSSTTTVVFAQNGAGATLSGAFSVGTTNAITAGTIELGHASDTTLSRGAAGRMQVEGVNVPTISSTDTLTNKTIALGSNTVSGTTAQFNTALSDGDFATLAGAEALTNKTTLSLSSASMGLVSQYQYTLAAVNFNSANTDNPIAITFPAGTSRYRIGLLEISGASASLTTATFGFFTASGGGGTAIIASGTAITVSTASEGTTNNAQSFFPASGSTTTFNSATLYFRIVTPQGSAATGNVTLILNFF